MFPCPFKACRTLEERVEQTVLRGIARPREAISSAISLSVQLGFHENLASRGKMSNIKHDRYFPHGLARRKTHENSIAHVMKQLSKSPHQAVYSAISSSVRQVFTTCSHRSCRSLRHNCFAINGKLKNPLVNGSNGAGVDESGIDFPPQ